MEFFGPVSSTNHGRTPFIWYPRHSLIWIAIPFPIAQIASNVPDHIISQKIDPMSVHVLVYLYISMCRPVFIIGRFVITIARVSDFSLATFHPPNCMPVNLYRISKFVYGACDFDMIKLNCYWPWKGKPIDHLLWFWVSAKIDKGTFIYFLNQCVGRILAFTLRMVGRMSYARSLPWMNRCRGWPVTWSPFNLQ